MRSPAILIRFFLLIAASGTIVFVSSQNFEDSPENIRKKYQDAMGYYEQANKLAITDVYDEKKELLLNKKALAGLKDLESKLSHSSLAPDSMMFRIYFTIGELEHYLENYQDALDHYQRSIDIQPRSGLKDSVAFKPLLYSGIIYYNRGKLDSAADLFLKADKIQQQHEQALDESQRLYNTLGVLTYEAGDYRQAKNYFRKALQVVEQADPENTDLRSNYLINIAQMQVKLQEYDDALASYEQLVPLNKNLDEVYHNMAIVLIEKGKHQQALSFLKKVKFTGAKQARLFNSFARCYLELKDYTRCRFYLEQATSLYGQKDHDITARGLTLKLRGNLAAAQDSMQLALRYYTRAIPCFYPAFTDSSDYQNPSKFSGVFSYINLYQLLLDKASAWHRLFKSLGETRFGDEELKAYRSAYSLLDYVLQTYETDEARLFINRSRYLTHDDPIQVAYELYKRTNNPDYLETLYNFDQKNKASVLALNISHAGSLANGPNTKKISELKKQITRLSLLAARTSDGAKIDALDKQLIDLELQLAKLRSNAEGRNDQKDDLPSIRSLQHGLLDPGSAIISYHLSTDHITTTVIMPDTVKVSRKPLPAGFNDSVRRFISALQSAGSSVPTRLSNELYHLVFDDILALRAARLIIIPDDMLTYLPFESLQDEQGNFALQRFRIQYQYSAAFIKKQELKIDPKSAISFAPFASSNQGIYAELPFSKDEVKQNEGSVFYDDEATKNKFLQTASGAELIHLATHAKAGLATGGTYLVFQKPGGGTDLLYEEEIYNMDLHKTKLVILSACETGTGKLMEGEGIMSLSRAFTYAGCNNIITSLWKADDQTTSYLTKKIHQYINGGHTIDEAVHLAKKDLLNDASLNPRLKHPYYWSHLIFIGSYQPDQSWPWKSILAFVIIVLVAALVIYRIRSLSSKSQLSQQRS